VLRFSGRLWFGRPRRRDGELLLLAHSGGNVGHVNEQGEIVGHLLVDGFRFIDVEAVEAVADFRLDFAEFFESAIEAEFGGAFVLPDAGEPLVVVDVGAEERVDAVFVIFETKFDFSVGAAAHVPGGFESDVEEFARQSVSGFNGSGKIGFDFQKFLFATGEDDESAGAKAVPDRVTG
jgi:hypothetical protein